MLFPGLVSVLIIFYTCFPKLFVAIARGASWLTGIPLSTPVVRSLILFAYIWLA